MKRANKSKMQSRNQRAFKFMENVPTTIYPRKKIETVPEVEQGLLPDEEYAAGFAENKKRLARTPPETLKKSVRNLNEDLNERKKLNDVKVNPQGETREQIDRRQIEEVKEFMNVEDPRDTGENLNVIEESSTRTGEVGDGTTSSSSDEDSSSEESSSSSEEETITNEQHEEVVEIDKKFKEIIETKSQNETVGNDVTQVCEMEINVENPENHKETESYVFVKGELVDITKINSFGIFSDICELLNRKPDITKINQSLRILCRSKPEKKILMETRYLAGHRVTFSEPYVKARNSLNELNRGIIFNVEEDVSVEQITHEFGIPATRIIRRVRGESIVTKQVILYFNGAIPEIIYFGWKRYRVALYIPNPTRCYNCQKFGHKANQCRSTVKCPICSGRHSFANCDAQKNDEDKQKAVCPNCNGEHPASYRGCRKYQEAKSIKTIQVSQSVSYSEAVKTFRKTQSLEQTETNNVHPVHSRPMTAVEEISHNSKDISSQDKITVSTSSSPPTEEMSNSINSVAQNSELTEVLINFVQTISTLLNGNKSKDELIAELHKMVENLAKSIK